MIFGADNKVKQTLVTKGQVSCWLESVACHWGCPNTLLYTLYIHWIACKFTADWIVFQTINFELTVVYCNPTPLLYETSALRNMEFSRNFPLGNMKICCPMEVENVCRNIQRFVICFVLQLEGTFSFQTFPKSLILIFHAFFNCPKKSTFLCLSFVFFFAIFSEKFSRSHPFVQQLHKKVRF